MRNVDVAVELPHQYVLSNLVSKYLSIRESKSTTGRNLNGPVNKGIVQSEFQNEFTQLGLNLTAGVVVIRVIRWKNAQRVDRLAIHGE